MKKVIIIIAALLALMFAEYRYIMVHQRPFYDDEGALCIEIFGQVDSYYVE